MHLKIFADGASWGNPGPAAIGVLIKDEKGNELAKVSRHIGNATNNQAEYQAAIVALEIAKNFKADKITLHLDSELIARQLNRRYKVRSSKLLPLYKRASKLSSELANLSIINIKNTQNNEAHALAKAALKKAVKNKAIQG